MLLRRISPYTRRRTTLPARTHNYAELPSTSPTNKKSGQQSGIPLANTRKTQAFDSTSRQLSSIVAKQKATNLTATVRFKTAIIQMLTTESEGNDSPCFLIWLRIMSMTMNVPVLPIPALKDRHVQNKRKSWKLRKRCTQRRLRWIPVCGGFKNIRVRKKVLHRGGFILSSGHPSRTAYMPELNGFQ